MIVVFGSSSDIGRRLAERFAAAGLPCRRISRRIEGATPADLETGEGVPSALAGATTVVSCAHARFTKALLANLPEGTKLVLTGSAWRYSRVPNSRAEQVRDAEAIFLASGFRGVMLHPAMIYGGDQENNIRRLLQAIRRFPVIPAPGGGNQTVCPIHVDDVVDCLFAAATREWKGARTIGIAGPPLTWRRMVELSAAAIGRRRRIVVLPSAPFIVGLEALKLIGLNILDPNVIRRFGENVDISLEDMTRLLSVNPRPFSKGIVEAVEGWIGPLST